MSYFSLNFSLFLILTFILYFCSPKKWQWIILLFASYIFYLFFSIKYVLYILFTTTSVFFSANIIERIGFIGREIIKNNKNTWSKEEKKDYKDKIKIKQKIILGICLLLNFGILFVLKYYSYILEMIDWHTGLHVPNAFKRSFIVPLGISFYTFQAAGYLIDVYREEICADKNIAKFALFLSFFPQIIQGPISKYNQLANQLYSSHKVEFKRLKYGIELIIWGAFKKLVIADRIAIAVSIAAKNFENYNGFVLSIIVFLYAIQLYADFSAGIDISRGIAEMLGIDMVQNFNQPYFAISLSDFWNRWHISLGAWMKNYIFYPIALSAMAQKTTKMIKKTTIGKTGFGEHFANVFPGSVACIIIFLIVGIWHGAGMRFVLYGLWNGIIIMISMIFKPSFLSLNRILHINEQSFGLKLFRILRTFLLVCIGNITDLVKTAKESIDFFLLSISNWDFKVSIDQIRDSLELTKADYVLICICVCIMLIIGIIRENNKEKSLRDIINSKPFIVQWAILFLSIAGILVFGMYGSGYNIQDFAYVQY